MYKAVCSYAAQDPGVLSICDGEEFYLLDQIDEHWWLMQNASGASGFVPAAYLRVNQVVAREVLSSIDRAIETVHRNAASRGGSLTNDERKNLQKLISHRKNVAEGNSLWSASSNSNSLPSQGKRMAPKAPEEHKKRSSLKRNAPPTPGQGSSAPPSALQAPDASASQASIDVVASKIYNLQISSGTVSPIAAGNLSSDSSVSPSGTSSARRSDDFDLPSRPVGSATTRHLEAGEVTASYPESRLQERQSPRASDVTSAISGKEAPKLASQQVLASDKIFNAPSGNVSSLLKQSACGSSPILPAARASATSSASADTPKSSILTSTCPSQEEEYHSSLDSSTLSCMLNSPSPPALQPRGDVPGGSGAIGVPEDLGMRLVDAVRTCSKINFAKSLAAVRCLLNVLGDSVPSIAFVTNEIRRQIIDENLNSYQSGLAQEDGDKLRSVFDELLMHKDDTQQRGWAVHEDFTAIQDLLEKASKLMSDTDPSVCRRVIQDDDYRYLNGLVVFYQLESRPKLRVSLLHLLGSFCELGADFISQLLCTVLPTELASDIMRDESDMVTLLTSCLMLTMLFSSGEPVPYHHYARLNDAFVNYAMEKIEDPPSSDVDDQVPDALLAVLLAFNLHFTAHAHNTVMHVVATRSGFRTFSEKLLLLLNREVDPTALFKWQQQRCPDSVLKLLLDLFASSETSSIFFTNDLYVLLDIVLRQLQNRSPKDQVRTEYLSLLHGILCSTNYIEHVHRARDFSRCFRDILSNAELESDVDVYIVHDIMNRFGEAFNVSE